MTQPNDAGAYLPFVPIPESQMPSPDDIIARLFPQAGDQPGEPFITPADLGYAWTAFLSMFHHWGVRVRSGSGDPLANLVPPPVDGDLYTDTDTGKVYVFARQRWNIVTILGNPFTVGDTTLGQTTFPNDPADGDLYYDELRALLWAFDGGSGWHKVSSGPSRVFRLAVAGQTPENLPALDQVRLGVGDIVVNTGTGESWVLQENEPGRRNWLLMADRNQGKPKDEVTASNTVGVTPFSDPPKNALWGHIFVNTADKQWWVLVDDGKGGNEWVEMGGAAHVTITDDPAMTPDQDGSLVPKVGDSYVNRATKNYWVYAPDPVTGGMVWQPVSSPAASSFVTDTPDDTPLTHAFDPAYVPSPGDVFINRKDGLTWMWAVDPTATAPATHAWTPIGGSAAAGITFVDRVGDLPDPATVKIKNGQMFVIRQNLAGDGLQQIAIWDSGMVDPNAPVGGATQTGAWRFVVPHIWHKALRSDPDTASGMIDGDLQITVEPDHIEVKTWVNGAWLPVLSDDEINRRIASLSLFEGTAKEPGGTAIGAVEFGALPDLTAMTTAKDLSKVSHYWTFIGSPNTQVAAGTPGIGADLAGAVLNPGDWLQIANRGTVAAPDLHWVTVGGDLLAKSRAERLFGLQPWAAGGWEEGSLVLFGDGIYRADKPVTATDGDPGSASPTNPWTKISLSGGTHAVPADGDLPKTAPTDEVWLVQSSAKAGGGPALYTYDVGRAQWLPLGGHGGVPIDMSVADELISIGVPIGTVVAYAGSAPPNDWLVCDGRDIPAGYKQLIALIGPKVPDLTGQFIRGGAPQGGFAKHRWTTGMPRNPFAVGQSGAHRHHLENVKDDESGSGYVASGRGDNINGSGTTISQDGAHTHPLTGGDAETAPDHVVLHYIIKAADRTTIRRVL